MNSWFSYCSDEDIFTITPPVLRDSPPDYNTVTSASYVTGNAPYTDLDWPSLADSSSDSGSYLSLRSCDLPSYNDAITQTEIVILPQQQCPGKT